MNHMQICAIIPARGGSKEIPGKNYKEFAGKPLIIHTIEQALAVSRINAVYVSTDDARIAAVAQDAGASVIERPADISGDTATTESAVEHTLQILSQQGLSPDNIVLLQATSPFRPDTGIADALDIFITGNYDSLLSISPTHHFFWRINKDTAIAEYDFLQRPRRQDMKQKDMRFIENGSLYIFTRSFFEKTKNRLGGKIGYIIFPEKYSSQIDSTADFTFIETLYLQEKKQS